MKSRRWIPVLAFLLILSAFAVSPVRATDCEFEFYYQQITGTVQVNEPEPAKNWWDWTKQKVTSGVNAVRRVWEKGVVRNFFPGEGNQTWFSSEDHNLAWKVNRVKVRDEKHLLELMGAKNGDESKLSNGQKALLEVFRHAKSQALKDRMPYSYRSKVKVMLTDTSGFDDAKKYPTLERDFWAYSSGFGIYMNSNRYSYTGSAENAKSTFVHEFSHSMDRTISEFSKPYGPDGSHYFNELTKSRVSFLEGWAEFNQMLDRGDFKSRQSEVSTIMVERGKGAYEHVPAQNLTGEQLTRVEGINALILYRLSQELPNGRDKVFKNFVATNYPWRSLATYLKKFVKANPGDAAKVAQILDEETLGKLSAAELQKFLGKGAGPDSILAKRQAALVAPASATTSTTGSKPVLLLNEGPSPFDDR